MAQLGEMLRSAREAKGVSLAQAEAATMIKRVYLQALEDDDHTLLPGAVYTKGFLRNYATYLGLDPNHVLSAYHREYPELSQDIVAPSAIKPHGTSQLITGGTLASAVLVLVIAFFSVYVYRQVQAFRQASPAASTADAVATPTAIPPTPTALAVAAVSIPSTATPAPQPTATPVLNAAQVTAKVNQDAWMQVQIDGQTAFEGVLKAGQTQTWTGKDDVFLWVGNAGGVNVTFNGTDLGALGAAGQVVKKDFKKP
jgi:cytoskeletal protein RodZ